MFRIDLSTVISKYIGETEKNLAALPQAAERYLLWEKAFPPALSFQKDVNLRSIADTYELTGSHIMNVV